ncbi:MAG: arylsulfatase B [Planctomycetota bacterium]|jgi:arylsulfatase B
MRDTLLVGVAIGRFIGEPLDLVMGLASFPARLCIGLLTCALVSAQGPGPMNILVITLDDVGIDRFPGYGVHPVEPRMPTMERLMAGGLTFERVWAMPSCSPSRASLLTGRFPARHGVYKQIAPGDPNQPHLDPAERTLPRVLQGYRSAVVGKWHLRAAGNPTTHPQDCGFGHHLGSMFNISAVTGYWNWRKWIDGTSVTEPGYATSVTVDDTLRQVQHLPDPWFIYMNFNAAHSPFHTPPANLHTQGQPSTDRERYRAMLEAMDTEIGRLLEGLDLDNLLLIIIGDNGTPQSIVDGPWSSFHGKGSLFEGGVRVPLIVHGPGVTQGRSLALVCITDIHATLAELTGGFSGAEDSVSFADVLIDPDSLGQRRYLFAERGKDGVTPGGRLRAISDGRWKLMDTGPLVRFYDLQGDIAENHNLRTPNGPLDPEARAAYVRLREALVGFP